MFQPRRWHPVFPAGKHDDQVFGQVLDRMGKGTPLPDVERKPRFMKRDELIRAANTA
jgi:hypothetical protein